MSAGAIRLSIAALALFIITLHFPALGQDTQQERSLHFARLSSADKSPGAARAIKPEIQKLAKGAFLVANKRIQDRIFGRSVILLIVHDQNGSMGLIINKQTEIRLAELFPDVKGLAKTSDSLYLGGPVSLSSVFLLVRAGKKPDESTHLIADIYISQNKDLLERMAKGARKTRENFRIYSGYAGWGAGQLEAETLRGDWEVVPAKPDMIFDKDPSGIWDRLMPQKYDI
jgi:putative transcriptional regulator